MNFYNTSRAVQPSLPYVVRKPADLRMLLRPRAILRPFHKPSVLVRIPDFSPDDTRAWERRRTPLIQECGCNHGAVAVGLFLLLTVAAAFFSNTPNDLRQSQETYLVWAGCFLGGLIFSAIAGKLFGLALAAYRLRRACRELETQLMLLRIETY